MFPQTDRIIIPPTGINLSCKNWQIEAPLRCLMNNLSPDVAEIPEELIVYGGCGKAARNWECFDAIARPLKELKEDETLLVQSGKSVGIFRTFKSAPRVLIANSLLVPKWSNWDYFRDLEALGLIMYGQMTAGSWIYIGTQGILQGTYETFSACAEKYFGGSLRGKFILTAGMGGMSGAQPLAVTFNGGVILDVEMQKQGAITFDYGNNIRGQAKVAGVEGAFNIPGFVTEYIRPLFCMGKGPFRWVALSGDKKDIYKLDQVLLREFKDNEPLIRWIKLARERVPFQGLPARVCWLGYGERARFGLIINDMVRRGELSAPIVIGRDRLDTGSVASPYRETEGMRDGSDAIADWPVLNALLNTASGATWVSLHQGGGGGRQAKSR